MRLRPKTQTGRRKILCDKCSTVFRTAGMTRVMRKIVFQFCASCWRDRDACELHMRRCAYGEKPNTKENAA